MLYGTRGDNILLSLTLPSSCRRGSIKKQTHMRADAGRDVGLAPAQGSGIEMNLTAYLNCVIVCICKVFLRCVQHERGVYACRFYAGYGRLYQPF